MGCIRKIFGLVGHSLSAIFQHAQLVATLVERLTRLLHLGCYAAGLVSQSLQVSGWSRDVAGNAPTGFTRWLTNWKKKKIQLKETEINEMTLRWKTRMNFIWDLQSSSRSSGRTPPPKRPLKKPSLGGSGISHGMNISPIKSPRVDLKSKMTNSLNWKKKNWRVKIIKEIITKTPKRW